MRVVIDTNVFVESISKTSPYHKIFTSLLSGKFFICVSNSILFEYEAILRMLHRKENAEKLINFLTTSPFSIPVSPPFNTDLIIADPYDNKFVDCFLAGNADYIVTSDRHFDILKKIASPKISVISPGEFIRIFLVNSRTK